MKIASCVCSGLPLGDGQYYRSLTLGRHGAAFLAAAVLTPGVDSCGTCTRLRTSRRWTLEDRLINQSILWRGIYLPGHEACQLSLQVKRADN